MLRAITVSLSLLFCAINVALGDSAPIRFKNAALTLQRRTPNEVAADLNAAASSRSSATAHMIIQFDEPITDEIRQKLDTSGITVLDYLGDNAFFAAVRKGQVDMPGISSVQTLTRSSPIGQAQKLHPALLAGKTYDWMIVGTQDAAARQGAAPQDPTVGVYVKIHADVPLDPDASQVLAQYQAAIRSRLGIVNSLVVELPYSQIKNLANEDIVEWIEPPLPLLTPVNDSCRTRTGADIVQAAPYNLSGSGITALVFDAGQVRVTHVDFQGRAVVGVGDATGLVDHSTHVAGTLGGGGVGKALYKGMAPGVNIVSYGLVAGGDFLYTDPGNMQSAYSSAINSYGADIATNSIGTNTASNNFPCEHEGDYGVTDTVIDAIVRGSASNTGAPFRICWANGNERGGSRCGTTYHTTAPPGCAKNHITVGALNSNNDTMTSFSSWGPADDDRMKPDIAGPGCQAGGDNGVTSTLATSDYAYGAMCGTSMATPVVAGISSLLLQDYCAQFPSRCPGGNRPDMRNSTLKILLAHTAVDLGNVGPDYQYGYGSVRIQAAVDFMRTGNFLEGSVSQSGVYSALVLVTPSDTALKVTLAWDDPAGTPNVSPALVNDLDLVVFDTLSNQRFPWTLGGIANPSAAAVQTQKNSVDNIEQVFIASPPAGLYRVEVRGFSVPQGPQAFSLCASPSLIDCSRAGSASLDSASYKCSSTATLTVVDCDLNADSNVAETVNVVISSTSEPGGEVVALTETGPHTAKFIGTIPLSPSNSAGVLQVANGDTVTLTYVDADDGQGNFNVNVTATASVDCVLPIISSVQTTSILGHFATVTFNTNESCTGTVRWGTSCGSLSNTVLEVASGTSHSIVISGLNPGTTYYYAVDAKDIAGNTATDNNSGTCYSFTTTPIPELFTEIFESLDNDLDFKSITFYPDPGISHYKACATDITAFPTDPTGGTPITNWTIWGQSTGPADDGWSQLTVSGGQTVKLHGVSYSSFFVSTNGFMTFSGADGDYTPSLSNHFAQPRISALYNDLILTNQGTCSWQQLADRFVVTWLNVPDYSTAGTGPGNNFQVELYFDGRISINYLDIANTGGLAGLSPGGGLSPDYYESNLSDERAGCPPLPPAAKNASVSTFANTFKNITLVGTDYNLDPLTYTITSLPAHGKLRDPVPSATIVSVPYTLASGGSVVRYIPDPGYLGADSFQFKVNDGGSFPTGGDSNIATVSISVVPPSSVVYSFPMDTTPGWTMGAGWAFGHPTGAGSGNHDPANGHTGTNVIGYTLTGDYTNSLSAIRYVTTTTINCTGLSGVKLRFWRWLGVENSVYDHANIQVSPNGTTFSDVWNHNTGAIDDGAWVQQTYDISAVADGQAGVKIRWGMGTTDATVTYCGWNIDDVEILANNPAAPCISTLHGDMDFNTVLNGGDIQAFVRVLTNPGSATAQETCAADCFTDGVLDLQDAGEFVNLLLNPMVP